MHPRGPPTCMAFNSRPFFTPPRISFIMVSKVVPMGTSTNPEMRARPEILNIFVPGHFSSPISLNHAGPLLRIPGRLARVSTLFTTVGCPRYPVREGKGGLDEGIPLRPSRLAIRAVSSPQTNAPGPFLRDICRL